MPGLILTLIPLLPFVGALIPFQLLGAGKRVGYGATFIPLLQLLLLLSLYQDIAAGEAVHFSFPWIPALGVRFSLFLDGLGWVFAVLIAGVGVVVFLYAASYLSDDPHLVRFYRYLLLFNGAMMGIVLADNLILLVVAWELTSLTSFLLIGFHSERPAACEGATKSLLITALGGLVMFLGILLLYAETGTLEVSHLLSSPLASSLSPLIGIFLLVGAFTKSAQFPFHLWLPAAMEAPTPVSAYLHAATMVKAGIYLVARLSPLFSDSITWSLLTAGIGGLTMLWGGYLACKQTDLKALLAYSTVSQLGLIFFLFGLGTPGLSPVERDVAILAALLHTVNHAAFKGALFLIAGAIEHTTGTKDLGKLGGLGRWMPLTALLATLATLSMAGLPPLGGFISKELFYEATLSASVGGETVSPLLLPAVAVFGGCLTFFYSFLFLYGSFFSPARSPFHHLHETPRGMLLPFSTLAAAALLFGLFPSLAGILIMPAVATLSGLPSSPHLSLWHGVTPPLALSFVTVFLAGVACVWHTAVLRGLAKLRFPYSFADLYEHAVAGLNRFALRLRSSYMTGMLTDYLLYMLLALLMGVGLPLVSFFSLPGLHFDLAVVEYYEGALAVLMALAALACCQFQTRVPLILSLGLVGALVSLFFVLFSAPDLALTQILVESVSLVLFLLVFRYLLRIEKRPVPLAQRIRNLGVSLAVGAAVTGLLLAANAGQLFPSAVTPYYLANSYELAGGRNVVNVIVVDFRGYDTMGEITVFSVAALAVFAMVRMGKKPSPRATAVYRYDNPLFPSPILRSIARLSLHLMLLFSLYLLLRGHNSPGGGFIAGVLTAVAIILQMVAFDVTSIRQEIPWNPLVIVAVGLGTAALTGCGALVFGKPFLTSTFGHFTLPLLGEVELATAALFDLGVYLVVVGTILGVIRTIAEG